MPVHKLDYLNQDERRPPRDLMRPVRAREIRWQICVAAVLAFCGAVVAGVLLIFFNGA